MESVSSDLPACATFVRDLSARLEAAAQNGANEARTSGSAYNVFTYIDPDENKLSDILRDLLDARGPHGQKDAFVRQFCLASGVEYERPDRVTIYRENPTSRIERHLRRIDILVDLEAFGVAIENKPWAGDQQ